MVTGSLLKRKDKWYAIICFNNNGTQTQKWINTGVSAPGNVRKADKFLKEKIEEYSALEIENASVKEKKLIFCDFLTDYLEARKPNIEDITYGGYKNIMNQVTGQKHLLSA